MFASILHAYSAGKQPSHRSIVDDVFQKQRTVCPSFVKKILLLYHITLSYLNRHLLNSFRCIWNICCSLRSNVVFVRSHYRLQIYSFSVREKHMPQSYFIINNDKHNNTLKRCISVADLDSCHMFDFCCVYWTFGCRKLSVNTY